MAHKNLFFLHASGAETASGVSNEEPNIANYRNMVVYIDITAFATFTNVQFILKTVNPVTNYTSRSVYNIMDDMEWRDTNGALQTLVASASEGNCLQVTTTGTFRGKLKTGLEVPDSILLFRWIVNGAGSITFSASAPVTTEE